MKTPAFTFNDVLLTPSYNCYESRKLVDISMQDKTGKLKLELPLISANMDSITESGMANFMGSNGAIGALHRFMDIDRNVEEFKKCQHPTFVSIGCNEAELLRAEALIAVGADYFVIDVAHAHANYVKRTVERLRQMTPNACIMAGNVATYAGASFLAEAGADIIKVGIGGGSVCTTRIKTGFGVPTLSSIQDCSRVDRSIVADGGIKNAGDVVKALAFGADFVMIGGLLAGTDPTPAERRELADGRIVKRYRGMASSEAHTDFIGVIPKWKTAEGISLEVPYRTDQEGILHDIRGGLRSGLTYGGAATIKELQQNLSYSLITSAGYGESLPHAKSLIL